LSKNVRHTLQNSVTVLLQFCSAWYKLISDASEILARREWSFQRIRP